MRFVKDNFSLKFNDIIFFTSTANENNTEGDIDEMGLNLAKEVDNFF